MSSSVSAISSSRFQSFLNHPAGPKTIHFWAPIMKWGLVIAGLGDLKRPAEHLSVSQNCALTATGLIWSRWSTQIIPKNYPLLSVNAFLAGTGIMQLYRIWDYRRNLPKSEAQSSDKSTSTVVST
ncbi:hypothetical protein G9A89_021958 [Geosiphon pyriformis]|nr:hypothetical protein G9A89_021958 [Geosiphon pyriformis]